MTKKNEHPREDYAAVDGPRIAAQIINLMPGERKSAILDRIKNRAPEMFTAIAGSLFNFEDLIHIKARGLQILVKAIEHRQWVAALSSSSAQLQEAVLNSMSQRMAAILRDDLQTQPAPTPAENAAARRLIVKKIDELRTLGLLQTERAEDIWV